VFINDELAEKLNHFAHGITVISGAMKEHVRALPAVQSVFLIVFFVN